MDSPSHLFIVGASRSGTSLLRNCLDCSDQVGLAGETHFLGGIRSARSHFSYLTGERPTERFRPDSPWVCSGLARQLAQKYDVHTDTGVRGVVDFLCKPERSFWCHSIDHFDKSVIIEKLLESDRSCRSIFSLIMETYAGDKTVWGEKTPAHIHWVPTLLKWFPEAKIVHILRDPRAVFLSQRRKKAVQRADRISFRHRIVRKSDSAHEVYIGVNVMCQWLRIAQLHEMYQAAYPDNYTMIKFESLVGQPEQALNDLCQSLGINYSDAMAKPAFSNSSLTGKHQLQSVEQRVKGFDKAVINRWQDHIAPRTRKWIERSAGKYIDRFNYA